MKLYFKHVKDKDDPAPQRSRLSTSRLEVARRPGGHVAFGLSISGNQRDCRKTDARRDAGPPAKKRAGFLAHPHCTHGSRRAGCTLIVLDASAAIEWLLQTPDGQRIERRIYAHNETLHAPHLLDLEVAQVLRRMVRQDLVSSHRAAEAIRDLQDLRLNRYAHAIFLPRIWQMRDTLSAYDAVYIALAETLRAPLITRDSRLASLPGLSASVEVF